MRASNPLVTPLDQARPSRRTGWWWRTSTCVVSTTLLSLADADLVLSRKSHSWPTTSCPRKSFMGQRQISGSGDEIQDDADGYCTVKVAENRHATMSVKPLSVSALTRSRCTTPLIVFRRRTADYDPPLTPHFKREPDVTTLIVERETMFVVATTSTCPANPGTWVELYFGTSSFGMSLHDNRVMVYQGCQRARG